MPHRFGIGAGCASPVSKPKWKILVENTLLSVDVRSDPNHTTAGPWTPGPLRTEERSEDVTLSQWRTERFTSKPPKDNQRAYVTKNRLVFRPSKLSPGRDPVRARTSPGCPRSVGKPRAPSLVVGSRDEQYGVEEKGKRVGVEVVEWSVWWLDRSELNRTWSSHIYRERVVLSH
jgi:hypothetical protein